MKIAIVVGHNERSQGAVRVTDGRTEYDWNGELAELIRAHDPQSIKIFRRDGRGGYSAEIDRVYAQTDAWGADVTIELHFNAISDRSVAGGLTLTSGTKGSARLASLIRKAASQALGNKDRGLKVRKRHDRGGRSLWQGRAPAVLTEPYFGSNADECNNATLHMDELAEGYYRAAVEFLGGAVKVKPAPTVSAPADNTDEIAELARRILALTS